MRDRIIAAAVLLASIATIPVAMAANAHAKAERPLAPVVVHIPYCAQAEDNCRADYRADGTWAIVPTPDH